ncbi:hypothetical protein DFH11DRAFT_805746 [Phellopilus nigrolimitatus]|nr:hypothetical protein DFH11DRAFT_805746 [Phellopilus nigrolimitatus]
MLALRIMVPFKSISMLLFPILLHKSRRTVVTSLASVLFKSPGQVPKIMQLLGESYKPHVCCDTLEPMTKDPDFVHQGAFVTLGMVLIHQSEASSLSMWTRWLALALFCARVLLTVVGAEVTIDLRSRIGDHNASAIVAYSYYWSEW